jgi:hypothetical protein
MRFSKEFSYFCNLFRLIMNNNPVITKALLLFTAMFCALFAKAQDPCEITCNVEIPVCSGTEIVLSVPDNYQYTFQWYQDNTLLDGQTRNTLRTKPVRPAHTSGSADIYEIEYAVKIFDQDSVLVCDPYPRITIGVKPMFEIDFRQVKLTCSNREEENGRNAQAIAWVDPRSAVYAKPFVYQWDVSPLHIAPGCDSLAMGLEAFRYYRIKVTDNRGCIQWDSTKLKAYPNPVIEITTDPGDTVYLQNPHETYAFENKSADTLAVSNFYWILNATYNLTSTEPNPRFTYVETGNYTTELKVYNPQGCDTSYYKTILVEPVKLKIPNVFTPNGDGVNDYFIIALDNGGGNGGSTGGDPKNSRDDVLEYENYEPLNRYYESSDLTIFNRWGRVVFHSKDYQNDWDGGGLSDGTYFYVLKCHGLKQDATYQGSVMIVTAQRQQ